MFMLFLTLQRTHSVSRATCVPNTARTQAARLGVDAETSTSGNSTATRSPASTTTSVTTPQRRALDMPRAQTRHQVCDQCSWVLGFWFRAIKTRFLSDSGKRDTLYNDKVLKYRVLVSFNSNMLFVSESLQAPVDNCNEQYLGPLIILSISGLACVPTDGYLLAGDGRTAMDRNGGWSSWSAWSTCSLTCSTGTLTATSYTYTVGTQSRMRTCSVPTPEGAGSSCSGTSSQTIACNMQACPSINYIDKYKSRYLYSYILVQIFCQMSKI